MKTLRLNSPLVLLFAVVIFFGCARKKPVLVTPQQPPATAAPTPSPTPAAAQADAPQETQPATAPSTAEPAPAVKAEKKSNHRLAKKTSPPTAAGDKPPDLAHNTPKKIVPPEKVEPPPTSSQISPGPTPTATAHDPSSTEQLLQNAELNLSAIKRQLTHDEEATLAQIKEFINLSHKATTENDPVRAHNLAVKARLLSDELVKQR